MFNLDSNLKREMKSCNKVKMAGNEMSWYTQIEWENTNRRNWTRAQSNATGTPETTATRALYK
jgi:hypothetical protein